MFVRSGGSVDASAPPGARERRSAGRIPSGDGSVPGHRPARSDRTCSQALDPSPALPVFSTPVRHGGQKGFFPQGDQ